MAAEYDKLAGLLFRAKKFKQALQYIDQVADATPIPIGTRHRWRAGRDPVRQPWPASHLPQAAMHTRGPSQVVQG